MKSIKSPVSVKIINDQTDIVMPLALLFLGVVVSVTVVLLVLA